MTRHVFLNKHQCQTDDTGKKNVHGAIGQYIVLLIRRRLNIYRTNKLTLYTKGRIYYG